MRSAQILRRFSFEEWGGTENVVWNSSRALQRDGISADILATDALSCASAEVRDNVHIRRFPFFYPYAPMPKSKRLILDKKGGNPISFQLARAVARDDYQLLHLHTGGRLAQQLAAVARRKKIPYVMSFHGGCYDIPAQEMQELMAPTRGTLRYGGVLDRILGWRQDLLAGAAALVCVGENELSELQQRYPGKRVLHLPNGVDPQKFEKPVSINLRQTLGIQADTRLLLCISRIDYQKDQKLLLELLNQLRQRGDNVHLLLIGPISAPSYFAGMQQYIKEHDLQRFATVIPGLTADDERLVAAYQQSDCFILPSLHEPFGIVVLEAWSAGLPVIASTAGGLGRLVQDGRTGIQFSPGNLAELQNAYEQLFASSDLRRKLTDAAKQEVETHYTWSIIGKRLANLYRELVRT